MKHSKLLLSVKDRIQKKSLTIYQAAVLGYDIFLLKNHYREISKEEYDGIIELYIKLLENCNLSNLLFEHIQYAIKIAKRDGEIEYEEMHKLFSLCDEIMALKSIGLTVDESYYNDYEKALRYRFNKERKKAVLAAEDKVEDWKEKYWWYSENQ